MSRTWQELFVTGEDVPPAAQEEGEPERRGFLRRLRENMSKTRQALGAELQATVFQSLDDEAFDPAGYLSASARTIAMEPDGRFSLPAEFASVLWFEAFFRRFMPGPPDAGPESRGQGTADANVTMELSQDARLPAHQPGAATEMPPETARQIAREADHISQ